MSAMIDCGVKLTKGMPGCSERPTLRHTRIFLVGRPGGLLLVITLEYYNYPTWQQRWSMSSIPTVVRF